LFEREHHRNIALVLQSLDADALAQRRCYFGGGTAMALRHGEYRESRDIDFLVSDRDGYRELRQLLGGVAGLDAIARPGMKLELGREVRTDQYGIRTVVLAGPSRIKFEIVLEGRIELASPGEEDRICGVLGLTPVDLAAEKLLANADRWPDDSVFGRDLIDLAVQQDRQNNPELLRTACAKAEAAYGSAVQKSLFAAVERLRKQPQRLERYMEALKISTLSRAQLWQAIRRLERDLHALKAEKS
jgi:hypothetical protein